MMLLLFVAMILGSSTGARILGIFPAPAFSHRNFYQPIMKALASRGHEVTVISASPLDIPQQNYTDIDISIASIESKIHWVKIFNPNSTLIEVQNGINSWLREMCRSQLASDGVQKFIKSNPKFDLVFFEDGVYLPYLGLIHHVGSPPVIAAIVSIPHLLTYDHMGNTMNPAHVPEHMLSFSDHMTFTERLFNTIGINFQRLLFGYSPFIDELDNMAKEFFGDGVPPVREMSRNFSLYFVNSHFSVDYTRSLLPSIIELGNLHIQKQNNPLPKDLQNFLDSASDGFIFISFGTTMPTELLTKEMWNMFAKAFAKLPQKVLWKWVGQAEDAPKTNPDQVKIVKYLPQQDVLAHPNIRAFVTQCGILSAQEAVHNAVPVLGVPIMLDQFLIANKLEADGCGIALNSVTMTKEKILKALNAIIYEPRYRENMRNLRAINKDQMDTGLERAVWWTEYVLRHNGAKHLRSPALDLTWYQYYLLDVIGFIVIILVSVIVGSFIFVRYLRKLMIRQIKGTDISLNVK